jgi:membrane protease YdiL (CAAX protease family)
MASAADRVRALLWNDREARPRAPWRLCLGAVAVAVAAVPSALFANGLAALAEGTAAAALAAAAATAVQVLVLAGLAAGLLLAASVVDRRRLRDLGIGVERDWWTDLAFGLALGVALPAVAFALELAAGYVRVTGTLVSRPWPSLPAASGTPFALAFALTAGYFVAVGVFEELLFRGYLLTNLAEGLRWFRRVGVRGALAGATVFSSAAFGLGHVLNPNATALSTLLVALYGAFLAAGYLLTGRLAVPVGVHVTWNLAVSSVFGFPVSGATTPATVLAVEQTGPALLTGGGFGPEAGLVSLPVLAVGVVALLGWVRWRDGDVSLRESVAVPDLRGDGRTD